MRDRTGESITGRGPGAQGDLTPLDGAHAPAGAPRLDRRRLLKFAGASLALLVSPVGHAASTSLVAVRVWPSPEYTRITLEGAAQLRFSHMLVQGCAAWLLCRVIPEPHNQQAYDLFIGEVLAAWADERVFRNGHWEFDTAPDELRTLHYVAGGQFYATGASVTV